MSRGILYLLTPDESVMLLVDYQGQMLFNVHSHDHFLVVNNVTALAKAAKVFAVPTILTTIGATRFAGPLFPEIEREFPEQEIIDRTTMNAWEDARVVRAIEETGRKRLIVGGLWTEVCLAFPVLHALRAGFEVYFVSDASGGSSLEAHNMAVQRMIQAGAVPQTWGAVVYEWQRDWARAETAQALQPITMAHSAYGQGMVYAQAMFQSAGGPRATFAEARPSEAPLQH